MRLNNLILIFVLTPVMLFLISCKKSLSPPTEQPKPTAADLEKSIKKGLWAYYPFSNGSLSDQSGNGHALTPSSTLKITYDMLGNPNEALEFNEAGDYAIIDAGKDFPDSNFSITFTMMPTKLNGTVFQKANYATNNGYSFSIGFDDVQNNNTLLFATDQSAGDPCDNTFSINTASTVAGDRTLFPIAWYYVCIIYQDGEEQIYINSNVEAALKTPVNVLQHCKSAPFYLGAPPSAGIPGFMGKIDNLRVYTRALTSDEVIYIMESNK